MEHGHLVLLVEDDTALLDLCTLVVAAVPAAVLAVESGQAARQIINSGQPICAVVANCTLRYGTGADVIRQARTQRPGAAGLLITGHPPGMVVDDDVDVLHKPFDLAQFQTAVTEACLRGCPEERCVHDWTLIEFRGDGVTVFVWRCLRCGTQTTRDAVGATVSPATPRG